MGLRWQPNADHRVELQLFHTEINNLIVMSGNYNPALAPPPLVNKNEATIDGLELSYHGRHER